VAFANDRNNDNNSDNATCHACRDKGHVSRDCAKNIEFNEWWISKNKNKVKASAFAQFVEEHNDLNAGNDSPAAQVKTEGQTNTNIESQNSNKGNQDG